ncbi:MAG: bifunctional diaminohydroxyphosphoribosylaminopyrimidine deaminase/5-amino-6-(5-phosphoribosylamino)uracil reductase RibD [Bacteroidota bacterium]|jgi:diaminohydroxyphosphoribosylaminopyrimidine deaminase/5-amino-6-(5-phosphoribosylamino)uracil reductase
MNHETYMEMALDLARMGLGHVAPNPLVGCVIVHNNEVIGKGFHTAYGQAHAEVEAISFVENEALLKDSTLYVNLEPCAHYGKTPPCSNLILEKGIPRVVVGSQDPFLAVNGKGIKQLRDAGVDVTVGVLEEECMYLNRRFYTFHQKQRPYIILKWAQSADKFMDIEREANDKGSYAISSHASRQLVHQWRALEPAILIGPTTALNDDPHLTVRLANGPSPIRIVVDERGCLPEELNIFNTEAPTIALVGKGVSPRYSCELLHLESSGPLAWLSALHQRNIQSVLVEGGSGILTSFIESNLWDEMRVFTSDKNLNKGLKAPVQSGLFMHETSVENDLLQVTRNI